MDIIIKSKILILIVILNGVYCGISDYKWMYFKSYGTTVHLEPLFNNTRCTSQSQCYWLLPDKYTRLNYPLNTSLTSKYSIAINGTLTIINIQSNDDGIYHFFQLNYTNWIVSKALLNLHGAPYDSLWLQYWPNVVGGLVAMAAVIITFILILLVDKYRYRPPSKLSTIRRISKEMDIGEVSNESVSIQRTNPGFMNDDNDTITSQKHIHSRSPSNTSNTSGLRVERF